MSKVSNERHEVHNQRVHVAQVMHKQMIAKDLHAERHNIEEGAKVVYSTEQTEKSLKKTTTRQRVEKDLLIVAPKEMREEKVEKLELEKSSDDIFIKYLTSEQESTISILGKMAALIAQADTTFRQTLWDQSTQTMQMTVNLAPILANLVTNQWAEQANATREDAAKDEGAGIGMIVAGSIGIAIGAYRGFQEEAAEAEEATKKGLGDGAVAEENAAKDAMKQAAKDEEKAADNAGKAAGKAEPKKSFFSGWGPKRISRYLKSMLETMTGAQMFGQAGIQLNVNAPHDRAKADHQQKAGEYDGGAKRLEGYQAWGNQITERGNQGVNAADQNHQSTIQTWKSVSDSLTNSLVSAWNKI